MILTIIMWAVFYLIFSVVLGVLAGKYLKWRFSEGPFDGKREVRVRDKVG